MGIRGEQQLAELLTRLKPQYRCYTAALWASGITSADELANASVNDLVTAGISNPLHAQDIKTRAGVLQTEYILLIISLKVISALLGPMQKSMQDVQVWYIPSWLANVLEAVKPFSRWLVRFAVWCQLVVPKWLPVLAVVLINWLGEASTQVAFWVLFVCALSAATVFWVGVFRDHLTFLQERIQSVRKFIEFQHAAAHRLRLEWGINAEHEDWKCLESAEGFKALLDVMLQHEEQLCRLFAEVPVGVVSAAV